MLSLFLIALVSGFFLQFFTKNLAFTAAFGFFGYVLWSVYQQFFVPATGGGASFWPVDILFAGPCSAIGAALGAYAQSKLPGKRPQDE